MQTVEYRCRDERTLAAPIDRCFEALIDLSTYSRWWTLVEVTPESGTRLDAGVRFWFAGARPGGERFEWSAEVREVHAPTRIELAYTGGEYQGSTAWELAAIGNATSVAYVYRGVRPLTARAREHFTRWGTRLHSAAMTEDALAGLGRFLGGAGAEMDDAAWRTDVRRRVAERIRALDVR